MAHASRDRTLFSLLRRLKTDIAGVAAVEFGLLAPLLLLMTFGTIELSRALIIHKRFQRSASMVGDLVTREKQLWPEDMADANVTTADAAKSLSGIMTAAQHSMLPYGATPLQITVYQVWANPNDGTATRIEWRYKYNWLGGGSQSEGTCTNIASTKKTIDKNVLNGGGRAVFVEGRYAFTPLLTNLLPNIIRQVTWTDTMVLTPRDVPSVMFLPGLNNGADWNDQKNILSTIDCSN